MWMSLRWSTRSGACPGGSSGTVTRRRVYWRASQAAYDASPAPATAPSVTGAAHEREESHSARLPQWSVMSALKDRLRADLTTAIKARDEVRSSTLRMVLTAITNAEVAGKEARELSDDDIIGVLSTEAKRRREAAIAFAEGGRAEMAAKEAAEGEVIAEYLPTPLTEAEVAELVTAAIAQTGAADEGMRAMGKVMGVVTPQVKGRADGGAVAAEVRKQLG